VTDGDTADVEFSDGTVDTVRIVGIDTPETGSTTERIQEYEGITDAAALKTKADEATTYAEDQLAGERVTLSFDENEPLRGDFGRLLGFLELPNGDVYNEQVIKDGWARVYSSGFDQHDRYWDREDAAQAAGDGIWSISDPGSVPESGDDPVSELFFPQPVAVRGGTTVVESEGGEPLVALDGSAGVAVVGGPLIDEGFEPDEAEGGPTNDGYQVYPFLTNLIDRLADDGVVGPVLFDGGHGQFNADFALSAEDVAYYQRYLEGQPDGTDRSGNIALEGTNDLTDDAGPALLDGNGDPAASALVITTPTESFTAEERTAVTEFADAGGAVVLIGTAANAGALSNFDALVIDLETSVGFTTSPVTDGTNNLGEASLPTTTAFPGADELFEAFTPGSESAAPKVTITNLDESEEFVVIENQGSASADLDGWTLSDETAKTFTFPAETLGSGETAVVTTNQTAAGAPPSTTYSFDWDTGFVWNNSGDTATLSNDSGKLVDTFAY
jgi:endonuclease YncB( thermonuclease family)